ncbi:MAG TPA: alpha/beta fold hydrolase [Candidatus Limnocylindrales bacterium]|nr:alpha/beta fold hydrolase [Candidatus Limnocylindrales bacterium]
MPYAPIEGGRIYYETHGQGPPVLMLMGFGAPMRWWFPQVPVLSRSFQVITTDHRGIGKSECDDRTVSMGLLASDAVAVLDHLDIERAHVVGLSYGGMIAQELVLMHPERVDKLILLETNCGGAHTEQPDGEIIGDLLGTLMLEQPEDPAEVIRKIGPTLFPGDYLETNFDEIKGLLADTGFTPAGAPTLAAQMAAVMGHDTWERLAQIAHPTLVVTGEHDVLVPPGNARILADRIPGAQIAVLPGAGHCAHIQAAEQVNALILEFLNPGPV